MIYDIIVIGAGTAGLTAAIYGRRADKKVLVLEGAAYGGQIIYAQKIENYPVEINISGFDFAIKILEQAKAFGAEVRFERVVKLEKQKDLFVVSSNKEDYKTKTIIIATGSKNRMLGLLGEKELTGKGVSYCATCDGALFKNKTVAVVGGGNTAMEDAIYLSDFVKKIYLIHRRDEFRADEYLVKKVKSKKNIEMVLNSNVVGLLGDDKLTGIKVKSNSGESSKLEVQGLFVAIGRVPDNRIFEKFVQIDESGYIVSGEDCLTKTPGVYVAGDCRTKKLRQLVTAAADGATAATAASKFISAN